MMAPIRPIASTAPVVSAWIVAIFRPISSVALAVALASSLTSLATTANPLPASPARAASIVAFRARRFVCSAIEVMTLTTLLIWELLSPSLVMVVLVLSATRTAFGRDPGGLVRVARDLSYAGRHLFDRRGNRVHVLADLVRGRGDRIGLGRGLVGAAVISWLTAVSSSDAVPRPLAFSAMVRIVPATLSRLR